MAYERSGNMMTLNLIHNGSSLTHTLEGLEGMNDADIKRVTEEVNHLPEGSLVYYVVDKFETTIFVRPKVPFGSDPFGFDFYDL